MNFKNQYTAVVAVHAVIITTGQIVDNVYDDVREKS